MRIVKYIISIILVFLVASCEDVIDVKLKNSEPKLVIDAALNWEKETDGRSQFIRLSLTAPFFDNTVPPATGATVRVTDSNNNTFNFIEDEETGIYRNESFIPELNGVYNLNIDYNNEVYTATERLTSVVPIDFIEQKNNGGFSSEEIEIKAFYTDPENIENFYLFEFLLLDRNSSSLEVYEDEFTNGNQIFAFYSDDELETGDEILVRNFGLSERTYEFFNILLQQTDEDSGDPFQTQPATVRGNCINQTNPDNFPLGYFRLSETDSFSYTIE